MFAVSRTNTRSYSGATHRKSSASDQLGLVRALLAAGVGDRRERRKRQDGAHPSGFPAWPSAPTSTSCVC